MLSVKYHLSYWAISATAAVVYHALVATAGWNATNFRKLLIPLAAYTLYLVYNGPRIRSKSWHICHFVATGCLMVSLGAIAEYLFIPGVSVTPIKGVIHTILAFSAIGALEPLRQNVCPSIILDANHGEHASLTYDSGKTLNPVGL